MTREAEVAAVLRNDPQLMSILTGGVLTDEEVGVEGIRRSLEEDDTNPTKDVFDADGVLKPCAVVRQRAETLWQNLNLVADQIQGTGQVIEIYFYQFRKHDLIELARQRTFTLLMGTRLPGTYPMWRIGESPPFYDTGPVQNSTALVQSWQVVFLKRAA